MTQANRSRPDRVLLVFSPKGGVGKSTAATNLLVAARLNRVATVGVDLDSQRSLATWADDRAASGREPHVRVVAAKVSAWREVLASERSTALAVVDTPPGLDSEDQVASLRELARASHLVIIPALPHGPTLRKL